MEGVGCSFIHLVRLAGRLADRQWISEITRTDPTDMVILLCCRPNIFKEGIP